MMLRVLLLVVVATLGACTSVRPPQEEPAPVEDRSVQPPTVTVLPPPESRPLPPEPPISTPVPEPEPVPPPPRAATPSSTLLASVDNAMAAGQLEQAAALCERALRISPRDGHLWYRLATIRFQQERFNDAAGLARRAMSFAGPDAKLAQDSQRLLQQAESRN
ncbi:MAG: tetratricopeptide repeat protein [Pseudomonadota bacterium]